MRDIVYLFLIVSALGCGPSGDRAEKSAHAQQDAGQNTVLHLPGRAEQYLGELTAGTSYDFDFVIANTTDLPMTIARSSTSCGCTVLQIPSEPIPPAGFAALSARVDTQGTDGHFSIGIELFPTLDSASSVLELTLKGTVVRRIIVYFSPDTIVLRPHSGGPHSGYSQLVLSGSDLAADLLPSIAGCKSDVRCAIEIAGAATTQRQHNRTIVRVPVLVSAQMPPDSLSAVITLSGLIGTSPFEARARITADQE